MPDQEAQLADLTSQIVELERARRGLCAHGIPYSSPCVTCISANRLSALEAARAEILRPAPSPVPSAQPATGGNLRRGLERLLRRAKRNAEEMDKASRETPDAHERTVMAVERDVHLMYADQIQKVLNEREPNDENVTERLVEVIWRLRESRDYYAGEIKQSATQQYRDEVEAKREVTHEHVQALEEIVRSTHVRVRPSAREGLHINGQPITAAQQQVLILAVENVLIRERQTTLTEEPSLENDRRQNDCDRLCGVISILRQAFGLDPDGVVYGHGGNHIGDVPSINEADEVRDEEEI